MPGKKIFCQRYYSYIEMMAALLNYEGNPFFKSIFDGEDVKLPLEQGGTFSYKETVSDIIAQLADMKPGTQDVLVNGHYETKLDYAKRADRIEAGEKNLNNLITKLNNGFTAYKAANQNAQDEKYMEGYKKFEYMENVFKFYNAFQKDFQTYQEAQGPDMPENADLIFDDSKEAKAVNERLAQYKKDQRQLYLSIDSLNAYLDSAKYDPELLSDKFKDKEITAQMLLDDGLTKEFLDDIDVAIGEKNDAIEALRNDTQKQIDEADKNYREVIENYQKVADEQIAKYAQDNYEKEVGSQSEFLNNINELIKNAENDHTALNNTIEKMNVCRDQKFATVDSSLKLNDSGLTELTDAQIDNYVAANNKNLETINQRNAITAANIQTLKNQIAEQDKEVNRLAAESTDKGYEQRQDVIALNKEIKAAQERADLAKQILKKANKRGGIKNITDEELRSIGVDQATQFTLTSHNEAIDAAKAIVSVIGNDLRKDTLFRKTNTPLSENLGAAVKSLDNIFDKENGTLKKAVEEYKAKNPGFEFNLHEKIEQQLDTLADFAGDNRRGQIYTAEDALAVFNLYKSTGAMTTLAENLPEDPAFDAIKAELGKDIKAVQDVCGNPKVSAKFALLAANAYEYGLNTDKSADIKTAIQEVIDSSEKTVKEKTEQKEYGQLKLSTESSQLATKRDENKIALEKLQKEFDADNLTKEYLEAANEAYNSVKAINANKKVISDGKASAAETKKKMDLGEKRIAAGQNIIRERIDGVINQKKDEFIKQKQGIIRKAGNKYNALMTEKDNLEDLKLRVNDLRGNAVGLQSTVNLLAPEQKVFSEKSGKAMDRLNLAKKAVMDEMNKTEKTLFERLAGTRKKVFSDSAEFTRMKETMDAYIQGCASDDNKTLNSTSFGAKIADVKQAIQAYIAKRDDSKWTESGQIRLDVAKQMLQMFNMKEEMLNQFSNEALKITGNVSTVGKMEVLSETEAKLVKGADLRNPFTDFNKNLMAPTQRRFQEGLEKIQEIFEPLKEGLAEKSQYINQIVEKGINGLAKGNIKAFTEGVAAVMALKEIEESNKLEAFNAKPEAIDVLRKSYSSSPEVQDIAKQLVTQKIQPKAFVESLNQQNLKEIKQRAAENAKKKDHKIDELDLKGLQ